MPSAIIHEHEVSSLKPHPANAAVYGDETLPEDFIASIRVHGIIEPLLIKWDKTIISGHRRWLAAKKAGLATVPARTCDFADELEEIEMLISSNKQRVKTTTQIAREGAELQRIEAERAALRRRATQKNEAAKAVGANWSQQGRTDEYVAAELGISTSHWKRLKTVFQKAQSGDPEAQELMKALDAGEISVHRAYQEVRGRLDEALRNPATVEVERVVVEVPPEMQEEMDALAHRLDEAQQGLEQANSEIAKARAEKRDIDSLLTRKAEIQEALHELTKTKDDRETYLRYAVELATSLREVHKVLESKKGAFERLAKTGIPDNWDARYVCTVRDLCYEWGEMLDQSVETVSLWGGLEGGQTDGNDDV